MSDFTKQEIAVLKRICTQYIASDDELDGPYGDKQIKKDPPKWDKERRGSYAGLRWSECPPDYLESLAGFYEWRAAKDKEQPEDQWRRAPNGKPYWQYDESDARLIRGHAARNSKPPPPRSAGGGEDVRASRHNAGVSAPNSGARMGRGERGIPPASRDAEPPAERDHLGLDPRDEVPF